MWLSGAAAAPFCETASAGFVTGGKAANTVGLAAARHQVFQRTDGTSSATVSSGAPRCASGRRCRASCDDRPPSVSSASARADRGSAGDGKRSDRLAKRSGRARLEFPIPTIICAQAGNVNTGACDDLTAVTQPPAKREPGSTSTAPSGSGRPPTRRHLVAGIEPADSWACDGHKWLNVPYDSRHRVLRRPPTSMPPRWLARVSDARRRVRARHLVPSRRAAPVGSQRGPPCARSAAREWSTSSTVCVGTPLQPSRAARGGSR